MIKKVMVAGMAAALFISCTGSRSGKAGDGNASEETLAATETMSGDLFLLAGTYTSEEGGKGIYLYRFNTDTGNSDSVSMVEVDNPSYLTLSPNERFIYAVSENNESGSAVHAFSLDKRIGKMELLNSRPVKSSAPCYITIDSKGRNVHTANYGGGTITSFQVKEDGTLTSAVSMIAFNGSGPDSVRQERAHPHCVRYSSDGQYLFAADLGSDKLYRFDVNDTPFEGQPALMENSLKEFILPAGTGPRHFDFHPHGGRYFYLLGELSGEVIVFDYAFGELTQKQIIAADSTGARGSADIHVSPDGRFLYASNRLQADGIAIFSIDPAEGTLTKTGYQWTAKHPRNFVITPNGKFLLVAGRDDDKIQVFRVDPGTGLLTDTHQDISVSKPVCLKFAGTAGND
ncbi:lactonase family protein [Proteiniphilum sp. X52]|uniref:lactonase family protein n=1 Tax=Proteiniphilum sp. X52 TaxID=2382159 RepID=UPI002100A268|nr:lactonase family protein [Proteiniphilum sp. X52]